MTKRLTVVLVGLVVLITTGPTPAWTDPAQPTNYQSTVLGLDPVVPDVEVRVVGGDSFLEIIVTRGVAVAVPGYEDEPYLRIDSDGIVSVNRNSPAYWLNNDRYAQASVPPDISTDSPPDWQQVASDGRWAWHDHRIHWMAPDLPPTTDPNTPNQVFEWSIPIEVDGIPIDVLGELTWLPSQIPVPGLILVAFLTLVAYILIRRSPQSIGFVIGIGGLSALAVSLSQQATTPPGAGVEVVAIGAAALAVVGGLTSATIDKSKPEIANVINVSASVLLLVWGMQRLTVLWMPVLPTPLPPIVERTLTAAALGVGLGALASTLLRRLQAARRTATNR